MKIFKNSIMKTITAAMLIIAMAVGMTASLGRTAKAVTNVTITYSANGGYSTTNGQQSVKVTITSGSSTTLLSTFARPGFTLSGWQIKGKTTKYSVGQKVTFTANTELVAVWTPKTIKITYALCGGTWKNGDTSQTYTYGNKYTLTPPACVRTGYTLKGWNTKSDGSGTMYQSGQTNTMFSQDTTLYAIWTPNNGKITYKENGGQVGAMGSNGMTQSFTTGKSITLSPPDFYRTGCTLLGFSTNPKASSVTYKRGGSYKFDCDTTLYAIWGGKVTYDPNGGTIVSGSKTQDFVSDISFKMNAPKMVKPKCTLLGFDTNPSATKPKYSIGQTLKFTQNTTLYAIWSKEGDRLGTKAIVIFPGIGGSNLFDSDGTAFFNKGIVEGKTLLNKAPLARLATAKAVFKRASNGNTIDLSGYDNMYQPLYARMQKEFWHGTEYEIVLYQYDWRKTCLENAKIFRDEVAKKYDKLILIGHSMGGLVVSSYLTLTDQKSKVEKAFFLGTPFLGAPLASYLFAGGDIDEFYPTETPGLLKPLKTLLEVTFVKGAVLSELPSFYNLLPDTDVIKNLGLTTEYNRIISLYENKSSGDMSKIHSAHNLYWTSGKRHISNDVKSYYIVGTGRSTITGAANNKVTTPYPVYHGDGDGTVPYYSASYPSKTSGSKYETTASHTDMISDAGVLQYIVDNIKK